MGTSPIRRVALLVVIPVILVGLPVSTAVAASSVRDECLLEALKSAPENATVGDLREQCADDSEIVEALETRPAAETTPTERRLLQEYAVADRPFLLLAHRPNYLLPYTYNTKVNEEPFAEAPLGDSLQRAEAKFQVSFKFPVLREMFGGANDLYFAFTNQTWWQVYNNGLSAAFRETDYEPELFWRHYGGPEWGPLNIAGFDFGLAHQSNGRSDPLSRSWNRVVGATALDFGDLVIGLRAWYRLPETSEDDDNPDIEKYMGYGELRAIYAPNRNTFSLMLRPAAKGGAAEATWSYPLSRVVRLYLQYYHGFGESLLDYDARTERIGIGIVLDDFLQR